MQDTDTANRSARVATAVPPGVSGGEGPPTRLSKKPPTDHQFPKDPSNVAEFTPSVNYHSGPSRAGDMMVQLHERINYPPLHPPSFIPGAYREVNQAPASPPAEGEKSTKLRETGSAKPDPLEALSPAVKSPPTWAYSLDPVSDVNLTLQYLCRNILDETVILDNDFIREKAGTSTIYRCKCILVVTQCSLEKILDFRPRHTEKTHRSLDAHFHRQAFVNSIKRHCSQMTLQDAVESKCISEHTKCSIIAGLEKMNSELSPKGEESKTAISKDMIRVYVHCEGGGTDKKKREAKKRACQSLLNTLRKWVYEGVLEQITQKSPEGSVTNERHKLDLLRGLPNLKSEANDPMGAFFSNEGSTLISMMNGQIQHTGIEADGNQEPSRGANAGDTSDAKRYSMMLTPEELEAVEIFVRELRQKNGIDHKRLMVYQCQCPRQLREGPPHIPSADQWVEQMKRPEVASPIGMGMAPDLGPSLPNLPASLTDPIAPFWTKPPPPSPYFKERLGPMAQAPNFPPEDLQSPVPAPGFWQGFPPMAPFQAPSLNPLPHRQVPFANPSPPPIPGHPQWMVNPPSTLDEPPGHHRLIPMHGAPTPMYPPVYAQPPIPGNRDRVPNSTPPPPPPSPSQVNSLLNKEDLRA